MRGVIVGRRRRRLKCMRFSDDMMLLTEEEMILKDMLLELNDNCEQYGMKIIANKTTNMVIGSYVMVYLTTLATAEVISASPDVPEFCPAGVLLHAKPQNVAKCFSLAAAEMVTTGNIEGSTRNRSHCGDVTRHLDGVVVFRVRKTPFRGDPEVGFGLSFWPFKVLVFLNRRMRPARNEASLAQIRTTREIVSGFYTYEMRDSSRHPIYLQATSQGVATPSLESSALQGRGKEMDSGIEISNPVSAQVTVENHNQIGQSGYLNHGHPDYESRA
ncbi:hypothetical protein ANN_09934 [Periplaneta americana]|uniref:Reverse transcriptase domain-containing protein n=1 Tax=Periplaneta americana TaxID=6978 RepID=A0ABQ8TMS9_PERAM|nr:hypothetical protein ANN_09934 [Periplaneta americana]